jgi:hypothetical protein
MRYENTDCNLKALIIYIYKKFIGNKSVVLGAITKKDEIFPERLDSLIDFRIGAKKFNFVPEREILYNKSAHYFVLKEDINKDSNICDFIIGKDGSLDVFLNDKNSSKELAGIASYYQRLTKKPTAFYYPKKN